jgi:hypothetical protein
LAYRPNAEIDIIDLYPELEPRERRELRDPHAWQTVVTPKLSAARRELAAFATRRVHIEAHMRLSMYFAVGCTFPDVAGWVLSIKQRNELWTTNADREPVYVTVRNDERLGSGPDLAVAVALTGDPFHDVRAFLTSSDSQVGRLLSLSIPNGPGSDSVPGPGWAAAWVRAARERIRTTVAETRPSRIHLFLCAPAGLALFLGHDWNLLPTTCVYEHVGGASYTPTMTLRG